MQKPHQHRFKTFLKQRRVSLVIIPLAIATSVGLIFWYSTVTEAKTETIRKDRAAQVVIDDANIAKVVAKKAAAAKAKQEAEAQAAADQAITANDATATTIDSLTCNPSKNHNDPSSVDVVVNKKHCIQPVTYVPGDLVSIGNGFMLSAKAVDGFTAMMAAAAAADEPLSVTSSYRSYGDQVATYAYWVNTSGAAGADTYSARPGYSEHQTGLAFDVADAAKQYVLSNFIKTSQYQWLLTHAAEYGFVQRYYAGYESITGYSAEEWHYRYVGVAVAKDMQAKGIKTLEQYWNISGGDY